MARSPFRIPIETQPNTRPSCSGNSYADHVHQAQVGITQLPHRSRCSKIVWLWEMQTVRKIGLLVFAIWASPALAEYEYYRQLTTNESVKLLKDNSGILIDSWSTLRPNPTRWLLLKTKGQSADWGSVYLCEISIGPSRPDLKCWSVQN